MAIAALVLGIVGLCLTLFSAGSLGIIGLICGIVGIILGVLARKNQPEKRGMATAGMILSIIAVALGLILYIACAACVSAAASSIQSLGL